MSGATAPTDASSGGMEMSHEPLPAPHDDAPPDVVAASGDWPLPQRDYDNTRAVLDAPINRANVAQLAPAWKLTLDGGGPFGCVTSSPIIAGDTIYLQDMSSQVFAIARDTGIPRWTYRATGLTVGPNGVALGWGRVFANYGDTGIVALDAQDGHEVWRYEPKLVNSEGVDIAPLPYAGMVLVSTVPASLRGAYAGGSVGLLVALDANDGSVRWTFNTVDSEDKWGDPENNGGGGAWYPPLVDADRGLTYWGTGNPLPWPGTVDQPNGSSRPGPNLYTSSLVALDLHSGALKFYYQEQPHDLHDWDFQGSPMRVRADPGGAHPDLVIGSGKTGTVVAVDPDTGKLVWRSKVGRHENDELTEFTPQGTSVFPGALGGVLTSTAYAEGVVYVPVVDLVALYSSSGFVPDLGDGEGSLVALDVRDGKPRWTAPLGAANYGAATVVSDLVFTSDAKGRVYAIARDDGSEVWHYDASGGINAPLAVAGDLLLVPVGINGCELLALRLPR